MDFPPIRPTSVASTRSKPSLPTNNQFSTKSGDRESDFHCTSCCEIQLADASTLAFRPLNCFAVYSSLPPIRFRECRRFCSSKSTRLQQRSTEINKEAATGSTTITWNQQKSTDFNKVWNLVRDQGVGGSNPLSPTNIFNRISDHSGFSSTSV